MPSAPAGREPRARSDWPLFRGDAASTGAAAAPLALPLELLWSLRTKSGIEATAVVADGRVYVGSESAFYALGLADGKPLWTVPNEAGFVAAAGVDRGRVVVGDRDGRIHCFDAETGRPRWHFDTDGEINSAANFAGARILVGSQDAALYCLNVADGTLAWKYESENQIRSMPTLAEGRAFVAGCDGKLHVVDAAAGKLVSTVDLGAYTGCTAAVRGAMAFVGTEGKEVLAIDWKAGTVAWRYESAERDAPIRSSAAIAATTLVVGGQDKLLHCLELATGRPRWTFRTGGKIDSSPVVAGDAVFVGSADGRLYAVGLEDGRQRWRYDLGGKVLASAAVASGRLVIGTDAGELFCFGAR